jgi:hypothetical protein
MYGGPPPSGGGGGGGGSNPALIVVLVLLVVAVVGGGIFLATSGDDDDEKAGPTSTTANDDDATTTESDDNDPTTTESDSDIPLDEQLDVPSEALDTLADFVNAEVDEDCSSMVLLLSQEYIDANGGLSTVASDCATNYSGIGLEVLGEPTVVDSSSDRIQFEIEESTAAGDSGNAGYELVLEGGAWLVNDF